MQNTLKSYFLAANSSEGFVSEFTSKDDVQNGIRKYIIKGGPGTGKSTFLKNIVLSNKAEDPIVFPCSSDPDSLDGVLLQKSNKLFIDGTPPHAVEPKHPGTYDNILDFGRFWDEKKLYQSRLKILEISDNCSSLHKSASEYLRAAGIFMLANCKMAARNTDKPKLSSTLKMLCRNYLKSPGEKATEITRFLGGTTPKGVLYFTETPALEADTRIILSDKYGFAASAVLSKIRTQALALNHTVITLKNPFLPSVMTDGIIIPKLSLAFLREYKYCVFNDTCRRNHLDRFTVLDENETRLAKFNTKMANDMLDCACESLKTAKLTHDKLEEYYKSAMDYKSLEKFQRKYL